MGNYKELDKIIATFLHTEKADNSGIPLAEAREYKQKHMVTKSIMDQINEVGKYKAYSLFPFGNNSYNSLDELFEMIEEKCNEDGNKYIYVYDDEPDHTMHEIGCDKNEVKDIIVDLDDRIEKLSNKLTDTIIFVIADHGHYNIENMFIKDYPEIEECLLRNTSLEPRAVNFFIKPDKKFLFEELFNKYFGNDFDLYNIEDVIESKLFGDGKENEIFRDVLGDYLAIAKTNKALLHTGDIILKSHHAGYTDDEIFVPLIMIKTNK